MAMAASSIPMNDSRSHQSDPLSTVRNVWHILPSLPGVSLPVYGSMPWPPDPVGADCPMVSISCALLRSPWQVQLFRPIIACIRLLFHKMVYKVPGKLFRAEIHGQVHIPFRISALAHMPLPAEASANVPVRMFPAYNHIYLCRFYW